MMPISAKTMAATALSEAAHVAREIACRECGAAFTAHAAHARYCKPCAYKVRYGRRRAKRKAAQNGGAPKAS